MRRDRRAAGRTEGEAEAAPERRELSGCSGCVGRWCGQRGCEVRQPRPSQPASHHPVCRSLVRLIFAVLWGRSFLIAAPPAACSPMGRREGAGESRRTTGPVPCCQSCPSCPSCQGNSNVSTGVRTLFPAVLLLRAVSVPWAEQRQPGQITCILVEDLDTSTSDGRDSMMIPTFDST